MVFKVAVIPCTTESFEARAFREADEDEGVVEETVLPYDAAPKVDPDTGEELPLEPGANDGQSRFGWSVWGAVQANPYLWGLATLEP